MNELIKLINLAIEDNDNRWNQVDKFLKINTPFDEKLLFGASDKLINTFLQQYIDEKYEIQNIFNLDFNLSQDTKDYLILCATQNITEAFLNSKHAKVNEENYTPILLNDSVNLSFRLNCLDTLMKMNPSIQDITKSDLFEKLFGESMFFYVKELEVLKKLVDLGANYQVLDDENENLLHQTTNIEWIEYLVSIGVDINAKSKKGILPIVASFEKYEYFEEADELFASIDTLKVFIENGSDFDSSWLRDYFDDETLKELDSYAVIIKEQKLLNSNTNNINQVKVKLKI